MPIEFQEQTGDVAAMDLVAHLLSLEAVDAVGAAGNGANDDVRQISMQFHRGLLRTGETAAAKYSYGHVEIAAKLLAHDVRRNFGCSKDGVQRAVDGHRFVDSIQTTGVIVALFL